MPLSKKVSDDTLVKTINYNTKIFVPPKKFAECKPFYKVIEPTKVLIQTIDWAYDTEPSGIFEINLPYLQFYTHEEATPHEYYYIRQNHSHYAFMSGDGENWLPFSFPHFDIGRVSLCNTGIACELHKCENNPLLYISGLTSRYMSLESFEFWQVNDFIGPVQLTYGTSRNFKARFFLQQYEKKSQEEVLDHVTMLYDFLQPQDDDADSGQVDSNPEGEGLATAQVAQ